MTNPPAWKVRWADPATLTPHPNNPRTIDPANKERLRTVLRTFGFVENLIVNLHNGYLLGGHQRLQIAIEEGWKVPVLEIVEPDHDREAALLVALNNRETQGTFDPIDLVALLQPLAQTPLLEASGFDFDQFQALILETNAAQAAVGREGQVIETPTTPTSRIGDVYQLGRHTLVVDDALHDTSYRHLERPADLAFLDPPYNVNYEGRTADRLRILNDAFANEGAFAGFLEAAFTLVAANTDGAIYICHASNHAPAFTLAAQAAGIHISSTIAWVKDRFVMGRSDYHWQWEPILYGWPEGKTRYWLGDRSQGNVWEYGAAKKTTRRRDGHGNVWKHQRPSANRLHPTSKPVALVEHALRNSSPPGALILDPFAGSGSTLAACENTGRTAYVCELDPGYADVIIARYRSLDPGGEIRKISGRKTRKKTDT